MGKTDTEVKLIKAQYVAYGGLLEYGVIKHRVFTGQVGSGHRSEKYYFPNDQKVDKRVIESLSLSLSQKGLIKRINLNSGTGYGWNERTADIILK